MMRLPDLLRRLGSTGSPRRAHAAALGAYALLSILLFGVPVVSRLGSIFVGAGKNDAKLYAWSLAWWPHAILTGSNPFLARVVFAPVGANLAWVTALPGPSLALAPVTLAFGPIVSSNLLALAAPALAAWTAYLLCHHVTRRFWPSLAGGFLFGFSTYEMAQMRGHLNLLLSFPIPLAVLLVVRWVDGSIGRRRFLVLLTLCLVGLFSISTELFATATMFGGIAIVFGFLFLRDEARRRLRDGVFLIALSYLLSAAVLSPYLYYTFAYGVPTNAHSPLKAASDLLSFVVPRENTLIGGREFLHVTRRFTASVTGDGGYLGIPLIAIVAAYGWAHRRDRVAWVLVAMFVTTVVFAMGSALHVHGRPLFPLPWAMLAKLPLLGKAIPDRFGMYTSLVAGVIVAIWLAERRSLLRVGAVLISGALLLPNVALPIWHGPVVVPAFISQGLYRRYLTPGETVITIPYEGGAGMLWQTKTNFSFSMAGGYVGIKPQQYQDSSAALLLSDGTPNPDLWPLLWLFLKTHDVGAILVLGSAEPFWHSTLARLGAQPMPIGGIFLYRLPWAR